MDTDGDTALLTENANGTDQANGTDPAVTGVCRFLSTVVVFHRMH